MELRGEKKEKKKKKNLADGAADFESNGSGL